MQKNIYGIAIQIGLHKTAEYSYLGFSDWRSRTPTDELKQVPDVIQKDIDRWRYIGVDACPKSVSGLVEHFYNIPSAVLVNAYVTGEANKLTKVDIFRNPPYFIKSISITLDQLVLSLCVNRIDVLAIDVEGDEVDMLLNYSFRIRPHFITVESHEKYYLGEYGKVENHLRNMGYMLLCSVDTNEGNTREYQFLDKRRGDV